MYSITEIIIQLLCFIMLFNSKTAFNYLKHTFPFFNGNFGERMNEFIRFCKFICDNNPLLIDYECSDEIPELEDIQDNKQELKPEEKFENKYLEKFKKFPNEFSFTEIELDQENEEYIKIREEYEKNRFNTINTIQEQLNKIKINKN
jgi:hypothetical protein